MLKISVICTLLNEGQNLYRLLDSLVAQSRPADEIVVVDGGSTDETAAILASYADRLPLRVLVEPGANISRGRNLAIAAAAGPIIASIDAGVRADPRWLETLCAPFATEALCAPFAAEQPPAVVAGFFLPDPHSAFEVAMGATVLPALAEIDPATFLPSSRSVAFLKSSWAAAGRYPEWLDYCEDLIFDLRLREAAGPFAFAPGAVVYFRPRSTLTAFFKQYYRYARGDGKADLWRKRHAIRYLTYLVALPLLLMLGAMVSPWWWLAGAVLGGAGMFTTPYRRLPALWGNLSGREKVAAILWIPIIRVTGDIAKMVAYPVGWKWRLERLPTQPELRWR
jgi:glycosyltransferase involved in cell wall biosynthesis